MSYDTVDLCAGPGGWDVALGTLGQGSGVIGLDTDVSACLTAEAAGFARLRGDIAAHGPADFPDATRLLASPPCQTFSAAGKGSGRRALPLVLETIERLALGERPDPGEFEDPRTRLVVEPLRWALDALDLGRPYVTIALEQVPTVRPVWEAVADVLRAHGYSVATGVLNAEQYGVPQSRRRAVLMARLGRPVSLPTPTHSRYHVRSPERLDQGVLPWVSMATALGWGMTARPYVTVAPGTAAGGADAACAGGSGARLTLRRAQEGASSGSGWQFKRPATTVTADSVGRMSGPGGRDWAKGAQGQSQFQGQDALRVSVVEAGILQTVPADYPWQGTQTKRYEQVGNAIPPLLALAILRALEG